VRPPPAHAFVNRLIALTLVLLIFSGTLGLGAVWVRQEISQAANRNRSLELKIADIGRRLDEVNAEVAAAVNPETLLHQNEAMRLGLVSPSEIQVVRITESAELTLLAKRNREIFTLGATGSSRDLAFRVVTASLR
jgi:hypothetical protein